MRIRWESTVSSLHFSRRRPRDPKNATAPKGHRSRICLGTGPLSAEARRRSEADRQELLAITEARRWLHPEVTGQVTVKLLTELPGTHERQPASSEGMFHVKHGGGAADAEARRRPVLA